ncbi:MAG: 30S ribosomal protein S2, partial [Pseudomonadota bacterium]
MWSVVIESPNRAKMRAPSTKSRRHPSVKPYIYGNKLGTDIIDLEQSVALIEAAKTELTSLGTAGKQLLLVGTKEEVSTLVKDTAVAAELPYVTNRWIG